MFYLNRSLCNSYASAFVALVILSVTASLTSGCAGSASSALAPLPHGSSATGVVSRGRQAMPQDVRAQTAPRTNYDTVILGDLPLAYYRMNDVTTLLHDDAPNPRHGNHGVAERLGVTGITAPAYTAAAFPGGDYSLSNLANVLPNSKLQPAVVAVEAWVNASSANTSDRYQPLVAYGRFSTGTPYQLTVTPINQFFFSVHTATGSPSVVSITTSSPGRTFHLVGTYDGASLKIFVNGVLEGTAAAAAGTIDYSGLYSWSGLAIGSGFDALPNHPIESYAGTIADVGIYNYALTPAQVMNHYLNGVPTPLLTERATSADAFVDSIGVNAPFNYQGTPYDTQYETVKALLVGSGIRHIRSGMAQNGWTTYYTRLNDLGASGIHSQLVTMGTETVAQIQAYPALVAQSMEAYEGPNEPDLTQNPNWIADTHAFMALLYAAVKGNPSTAHLPVVGTSVVEPANVAAYGNDSASLDFGNIHPYYGPNNPGNSGTGSITPFGRSGSIAYYMNVGAQVSSSKPMIAGETGFSTGDVGSGNVSELCDGKEAPRTYFDHFKSGIARTLAYQFIESGSLYGALGSFSYMGFLRQDLTTKPSYNAIKSLTGLLSDRGGSFTTGTLSYTLGGDINNLDHLLMQKRDGTYYLALWLEVPSWNSATNTDINAPPQSISVVVPASVTSGWLYSLTDAGMMGWLNLPFHSGSITVPITDRITVLSFHP